MANQTKTKIADIGEILGKKGQEFTFIDPPLIDAPNTEVTKNDSPRQLPDPALSLKPLLGIERIRFNSATPVTDERGPNGEQVYEGDNKDARVRFVDGGASTWANISDTNGSRPNAGIDAFVEIVFFGTGLNLVTLLTTSDRDAKASIDGGGFGSNIFISGASSIIQGRNFNTNQIVSVASGLALGLHSAKIRIDDADGITVYGFEILNEDTQIQIPQGEMFDGGRKFVHPALEAIAFDSGFDGAPILNGKGGRAAIYITPEGTIGKALQQTDITQLNLAAADHSNEEETSRPGFRVFGRNRGDDFATITTANADRAFNLDDDTTSLMGIDVRQVSGKESIFVDLANGFVILNFIGTGLDIVRGDSSFPATIDTTTVFVDGASIGTITGNTVQDDTVTKIVSGLPYGTHTVKMRRDAATTQALGISHFIIYGPKKPNIPENSAQLQEYHLMSDFAANNTTGQDTISGGILRKAPSREVIYAGSAMSRGFDPGSAAAGIRITLTDSGDTARYLFFGTGIELRSTMNSSRSPDVTMTIDGLAYNDTNFVAQAASSESSFYGPVGTSFTASTGVWDSQSDAVVATGGLIINGLSLGLHEIIITNNNANNFNLDALDIITPVHFPDIQRGSLSMGPGLQLNKKTESGGIDLSRAKAWCVFDASTNTIHSSLNIAAVFDVSTGDHIFYFEKPFKGSPAFSISRTGFAAGGGGDFSYGVVEVKDGNTTTINKTSFLHAVRVNIQANGVDNDQTYLSLLVFGELADEEGAE